MKVDPHHVTRAEGLARLAAFTPRMGRAYAATRNTDFGPDRRDNISGLSPWILRRLLDEREVVAAALSEHGAKAAEKFVQEVVWRGYFKGWLEHRPQVWTDYRRGLEADLRLLDQDAELEQQVEQAIAGETGMPCFDAWAQELRQTGYLHNHTRMWFASIWIFTLRLPWRLGADFFLSELLDGDAASNTLSWRWVGGLHTVGKHYIARAANITKHTDGRFTGTKGLAIDPAPLDEGGLPPRTPLRQPQPPAAGARRLWLITEADCSVSLPVSHDAVLAVAGIGKRAHRQVSAQVRAADRAALGDALARAGGGEILESPPVEAIVDAVRSHDVSEVVTAYLPRGWIWDWAEALRPKLASVGVSFAEVEHPWDQAVWPHATAGFFKVKKQIPKIVRQLGEDVETLPLFASAR